ncbi:unnamed protein product [Ectocarpus sp. 6 AP-2014]
MTDTMSHLGSQKWILPDCSVRVSLTTSRQRRKPFSIDVDCDEHAACSDFFGLVMSSACMKCSMNTSVFVVLASISLSVSDIPRSFGHEPSDACSSEKIYDGGWPSFSQTVNRHGPETVESFKQSRKA